MINKLKETREIKNITQEYISREINISLTQYRNIERQRSIPSVEIAIRIARFLDTTVEELFIIE